MAVIAVPAFNNYSVRADTQAKAEEIKYLIEKAYISAQNPVNGNSGSMIGARTALYNPTTLFTGKFNAICATNINSSVCRDFPNPTQESVLDGTYIKTITYVDPDVTDPVPVSQIVLKFRTPANSEDVYICPEAIVDYDCDIKYPSMTLSVKDKKALTEYQVIVHRYPFNVEVVKIL